MLPEDTPITVDGRKLTVGDEARILKVGVDGITVDLVFEWLYFAPLNGSRVYRIKLDDIANVQLTDVELGNRVEEYAHKPNNGGLGIDRDGNLYLTAVEGTTVGVISATDRKYREYAGHPEMGVAGWRELFPRRLYVCVCRTSITRCCVQRRNR